MTAQMHEKLILDGEKTSMAFCPPLPENDSRIVNRERKFARISSGCWRGYVGTWEIKDDKFYLVDLEGRLKLAANTPVFADWFTGTLMIPQGEMLHYVHGGFASVYEREMHIEIETGIVTKFKTIDNRNKNMS